MRTVHNGYRHEWRNRPLRRLILSNLLYPLMFDIEIGVAPSIVSHLNRRWVAKRIGKVALLVPNAINLARFAVTPTDPYQVKQSLGIPNDAFVVGTIGRLAEEKNYGCLLQAAAIVLQQLPDVYFLIVGEGELADSLKRLATRLNIAPRVNFMGPRPDVERLLAGMDLFVSSSLWEGISTTILESMAAGVPVAATDIPGTRELVHHLENGWLAPPADATALARTIVEALHNPLQREEFVRRAREVAQRYAIEKIAAEYKAIYSAAVQRMA
jgi:glycosyltransferase involved in cell wall biosynthesis